MTRSSLRATESGPRSSTSGRFYPWIALLLLLGCYIAYGLDRTITAVVIEPVKTEFALSDFQISALTGLTISLPFAIACVPLGMIADRANRKWFLVVLMASWSLMTGAAGLATTVFMLFAARVAVGVFESGFTPNSMSMISDIFPPKRRATALGLFSLGAPAGVFCGLALGGMLADQFGWRAAFLLAGVPGLVLALLVAIFLRDPVRGAFDTLSERPEPAPFKDVIKNIWADRALFNVVGGMACCIVLVVTLTTWVPSLLMRAYGLDLKAAGLSAALIAGACGGGGVVTGGLLADALGRRGEMHRLWPAIAGAALAVVFGLSALFLAPSALPAIVLLGLCAFSVQMVMGPGYGLVLSLTTPAMRATTLAVLLVVFNVGSQVVGSLIVGFASDMTAEIAGPRSLVFGFAATLVPTALGAWMFLRAQHFLGARGVASPTGEALSS